MAGLVINTLRLLWKNDFTLDLTLCPQGWGASCCLKSKIRFVAMLKPLGNLVFDIYIFAA